MAATTRDHEDVEVRITYAEGVGYSARHVESGVASQGATEEEALVALAEALALHRRDDEDAESPDDEWFERHCLDPDDAEPGDSALPDFLQ